jgi:hypothetical protein
MAGRNIEMDEEGDLHYKMCKKIAQLTKVIYHLHSKNEEHEYEMRDLANAYELQVEQVKRIFIFLELYRIKCSW